MKSSVAGPGRPCLPAGRGRDGEGLLASATEQLPARRQHADHVAAVQHSGDERRHGVHEMLAVVEHEEDLAFAQPREDVYVG